MADDFDAHLSALGFAATEGLSKRRSRERNSGSSAETSSAGRLSRRAGSLQNVTGVVDVRRVSTEIADTEETLNELQREIEFLQRRQNNERFEDDSSVGEIRHSTPRTHKPYCTLAFLLFCVIMFIIEIAFNHWAVEELSLNPLVGPSVDVLSTLGAKDTELLQSGEWWRLFAPMVLHVGIVHLLANMLGLVSIGIPMEQEFGTFRIAIVLVASGFFGVVTSALFAPHIIGVGASGAIFGLFGAAWADLIQNWSLYRGKNRIKLLQLSVYTIFNFLIGLMPYLDNFAHIGGFVCGLITGLALLVKQYGETKRHRTFQICLRAFAAIAMPIIVGAMVFLLFIGFDIAANCGFCSYLTCVPMPPRADKDDRWWDCTPCTNGFGGYEDFEQGLGVNIICPNSTEIYTGIDPSITEPEFKRDFIYYCALVCES